MHRAKVAATISTWRDVTVYSHPQQGDLQLSGMVDKGAAPDWCELDRTIWDELLQGMIQSKQCQEFDFQRATRPIIHRPGKECSV